MKTLEMQEICSKLTIDTRNTPEQHQQRRSVVPIIDFEQILYVILVFLITLNKQTLAGNTCPKLTTKIMD